jgi:hypothetical protein
MFAKRKKLQDAPVSQNRNTALEPVQERKYIRLNSMFYVRTTREIKKNMLKQHVLCQSNKGFSAQLHMHFLDTTCRCFRDQNFPKKTLLADRE